jgi:hypothetical protein
VNRKKVSRVLSEAHGKEGTRLRARAPEPLLDDLREELEAARDATPH